MQNDFKRLSISFPSKLYEGIEDFRHERRFSSITKSVEELCRIALTFVEGKEHVNFSSDLSKDDRKLVDSFNLLNQQGRKIALRTVADLAKISDYQKANAETED